MQVIVWGAVWLIAMQVLFSRCGGFICSPAEATNSTKVPNIITGSAPLPTLPAIGAISQIDNIIQANWFYAAFIALIVVSSVIMIRAYRLSWEDLREEIHEVPTPQTEGIIAVKDAIQILESQEILDPRERIINCYQRMILAAQNLGAPVTSDQTARELETAIRNVLNLHGSAITRLTDLFEEARYSLHIVTELDAQAAHQHLTAISEEMKLAPRV